MIIQLTFTQNINDSLQIGDIVYYTSTSSSAGFTTGSTNNAIELGPVEEIDIGPTTVIKINYDDSPAPVIPTGSFILFKKSSSANISSIIGYYAEVEFVNVSNIKSEIFSASSVVRLNSK